MENGLHIPLYAYLIIALLSTNQFLHTLIQVQIIHLYLPRYHACTTCRIFLFVHFLFSNSNSFSNCSLLIPTAALNCHRIILLIRIYESLIRIYESLIRIYELLIRNYELLIRNYDLLICKYQLVIRNYELVFRNYELRNQTLCEVQGVHFG